jgi:chromosome segregation ATPase
MAYYDHGAAMRKKECADKYAELKKYITSKDKSGKLNEWFLAHEHIVDLESKLQEQEKQIEEYRSFFSLMRKLLPRVTSILDVIG